MHHVAVADPVAGWGERKMKLMQPSLVTIFFMTIFYRVGAGGIAPWTPWIDYCVETLPKEDTAPKQPFPGADPGFPEGEGTKSPGEGAVAIFSHKAA